MTSRSPCRARPDEKRLLPLTFLSSVKVYSMPLQRRISSSYLRRGETGSEKLHVAEAFRLSFWPPKKLMSKFSAFTVMSPLPETRQAARREISAPWASSDPAAPQEHHELKSPSAESALTRV